MYPFSRWLLIFSQLCIYVTLTCLYRLTTGGILQKIQNCITGWRNLHRTSCLQLDLHWRISRPFLFLYPVILEMSPHCSYNAIKVGLVIVTLLGKRAISLPCQWSLRATCGIIIMKLLLFRTMWLSYMATHLLSCNNTIPDTKLNYIYCHWLAGACHLTDPLKFSNLIQDKIWMDEILFLSIHHFVDVLKISYFHKLCKLHLREGYK